MGQGTIRQFILELPIKSHLACYSLMAITQHHTIQAKSPWTVQITLGISLVGLNLLEPKPWPSWPQQIPIHYITLKQKVKQVGEKPLPSRSLSKLPKSGTHSSSVPWGATLLLASPETDGPIAENFREKVELLSLKSHTFPLSSVCSLFFLFSLPLPIHLVKIGTRDLSSQRHVSISHWTMGLHPYPYPTTLRFSSNGMMPCVTSEPHLSSMFDSPIA